MSDNFLCDNPIDFTNFFRNLSKLKKLENLNMKLNFNNIGYDV